MKTLLYGPPKIGKSTLASRFPGAWFWATEEGYDYLDIYEPTIIDSYATFEKLLNNVLRTKPRAFGDGSPIRTIVIDTIDLLFKLICDATVQRIGKDSMFDIEHGKGWFLSGQVLQKILTSLAHLPYGVVLISHAGDRQLRAGANNAVDRIEPAMVKTGRSLVTGWADLILYCQIKNVEEKDAQGKTIGVSPQRALLTQPRSNITAGDRSGRLPPFVPMDYNELVKYFPDTPTTEDKGE